MGDDHDNAQHLAQLLEALEVPDVFEIGASYTNIIFGTVGSAEIASRLTEFCRVRDVFVMARGTMFRVVTHIGVTRQDCDRVAAVIGEFLKQVDPKKTESSSSDNIVT